MQETRVEKVAYRIPELVHAFGIGRTKIYQLINHGQFQVLKSGRVTMISAASVQAWMRTCLREALEKGQVVGTKSA